MPSPLAPMEEMFRLILLSSEESAPTWRLKSIASFRSAKASTFNSTFLESLINDDTILISSLWSRLIADIRASILVKAFLLASPDHFSATSFTLEDAFELSVAVALSTKI